MDNKVNSMRASFRRQLNEVHQGIYNEKEKYDM